MGESVHEATITKWLKAEGDRIEADESIVEIATDKVDSEIPAPISGVLTKIMCKEGDTVQVGSVIALIAEEGEASLSNESEIEAAITTEDTAIPLKEDVPVTGPAAQPTIAPEPELTPVATQIQPPPPSGQAVKIEKISPSGRFYSPLVRKIAIEEGIQLTELEVITGNGKNGRVTKKDIVSYLQNRSQPVAAPVQPSSPPLSVTPPVAEPVVTPEPQPVVAPQTSPQPAPAIIGASGDIEIIEMDRMRKLIAEHMVRSKQTSPHVTSYVEADVTNIVNWRNKIKEEFLKREGEKITYTPIFIEAATKAIRDFPMVNVSVDGTKIIVKKNINIGMATALPSGNLIVPVIKNADRMNLLGLTKSVNDLANRARTNKLKPDEIQEGTFSITNVGVFGNVMGTPIINQPQAAILAVGIIKKKPVVIDTPQGDAIAIRHMMFLSLSYDHRVVDGALGGSFLRKIADYLEQFNVNREYS